MKAERTIYVRIKIGNRTFDNDNVVSIEYDSGSLSGEIFAIGSTYSNSIKITFSELVEGLKELDEVSYEIGIKLSSGAIEYVPMGIFIINDAIGMDRNNNKTTIECMDRMIMMGGTYVSSLTYPAAIREVALEIANKSGLVVDSTSFERLSADKIAKPEGYNYREAIGLIAQFEAGFATFNRYGKLEIRTLSDPNFAIPPDNYFSKGLVKNEVFFRLGGISCVTDYSDATIQSGNTAGNQVVLENRIMTKLLLDKVYQKIQTINYYPFSLNWQGNPVLEAGDWVVVEDLQGNKFKTPNLNYSLSFSGGLTAKSSAETTTQSDVTYGYKSQLQQKIEWIYAQIDAAGGNLIYEGINEPTNPKEGDLWFKIIGPDKQILIFKKKADGTLFWEPQISTADINKVAEEVNKIIDQADKDRTKAEQEISQALLDAKNYTEIKAQEFDNQLLIVNQNVTTATNSANAAVLKADKAIEDVGFLKPDVAAAKANAITAIQYADTATQNATTAIQNAKTALNSVATLSQEVEVTITNINGELTRKVSQTTFNTLNGTVGTHTTQIGQTQNALLAKAESSLVNTIKGTVDTHTTQIKIVSDGLEVKAESSLVNTVKGTVDNHSSLISTNSQAISARLTSAQIETLLTGKQYVNQTTLAATSSGLTAQITQVSTDLSNLDFDGKDLINRDTLNEGYLIKTGELRVDTAWVYTDYIPVVSGDTLLVSPNWINLGIAPSTVFYNSSKIFISAVDRVEGRYIVTVSETGFVRFSFMKTNLNIVKLQKGSVGYASNLEKFTTLNATVDGIQKTVGTKASQTQVTQLANQISTKVESTTYTSKMTQLDSAINLRVVQGDVTAAILADKTIIDNRNDNQLPAWYMSNYPKQTVEEFKLRNVIGAPGSATYGHMTTKVPWKDTAGGSLTQTFSSNDGIFQRQGTTSWGAWDKIAETGKLLSQINLSSEGILIQGKRIQLDGDVTMTAAFVTRLDALTLTAVYADIATLKTKVLTADVITSTQLKTDTALITKLFATDANVNVLTAKSSFINSVKAIDIAADRITAGTLNGANVNIINLNVSSLVGNISSFIQSYWNGISTSVSIDNTGVLVKNNTSTVTARLKNGFIEFGDNTSDIVGGISTAEIYDQDTYYKGATIYTNYDKFFAINKKWVSNGAYEPVIRTAIRSKGLDIFVPTNMNGTLNMGGNEIHNTDRLYLGNTTQGIFRNAVENGTLMISAGGTRIATGTGLGSYETQLRINASAVTVSPDLIVNGFSQFYKTMNMNGNQIHGVDRLYLNGTTNGLQLSGSRPMLNGSTGVFLAYNGAMKLDILNTVIRAYATLDMNGNSLIGNSDRRLKKNIVNSNDQSLESISRWRFVNYEWIDTNKPNGVHLGVISQETPELCVYDQKRDIYSIDSSKQMMMNSHAIKQLNQKVVSISNIANASNTLASRAFSEMQQLKNKVTELELKIKKLESAA